MRNLFAFIFTLIVILGITYTTVYHLSQETIDITIKDKERITTGSGETISSKFIVYDSLEVFENTDALIFWKFNSADVQNNLNRGEDYTVRVAGWRVPFLSMYRNIIEIEK